MLGAMGGALSRSAGVLPASRTPGRPPEDRRAFQPAGEDARAPDLVSVQGSPGLAHGRGTTAPPRRPSLLHFA
jgi:hypothetical protein